MPNLQFVPECYAETEMVKLIFDIGDNDYLNHAEGIHSVSRILKQDDVRNFSNIGFIDNDKRNLPPYFDEFETIDRIEEVIFKKHNTTNDYLVFVNPAIEGFILSQLQQINKFPSDYDLPNHFKEFRHKLKKQNIKNHDGYKQMIRDLLDANTSGIQFIRSKIDSLKNL